MRIKLLFVCKGNICRSPTAEAIMKKLVHTQGVEQQVVCDSAGIIGYHIGEKADSRMRARASLRGYHLLSRSRQFAPEQDFDHYDHIIVMDDENYDDLMAMDEWGKYGETVSRMVDYCENYDVPIVPDPYYGGDAGFDLVLDLLEDACQGLLSHLNLQKS